MAALPLRTGTTWTREAYPLADIASAAAKTGKDSIVVEFTAILSGGTGGVVAERAAVVRTQTFKRKIIFETVMVR
jgi:hypothetical protein